MNSSKNGGFDFRQFWRSAWSRVKQWLTGLFTGALFVCAAILISRPDPSQLSWAGIAWPLVLVVSLVLFALLAPFPLTFFAYQASRRESKIQRLSKDFRLLGLCDVREPDIEKQVGELYDRIYNPLQYMLYIVPILVFSIVVLAIYAPLSPFSGHAALGIPTGPTAVSTPLPIAESDTTGTPEPEEGLTGEAPADLSATPPTPQNGTQNSQTSAFVPENPDVIRLIFFAWLGAYVCSLLELIRRYNTFDLQPQVYATILARMVTAVALVFVGSLALFNAGSGYEAPPSAPGFAALWLPGIVAFVIGAFPHRGLDWFWRLAEPVLAGRASESAITLPIEQLSGMSNWHASRLQQIGIDDAQNLAGADLSRLLLTTPFDAQVIVNWVDQALLYTRVGSAIDTFRRQQISTLTQLTRLSANGNASPEPPHAAGGNGAAPDDTLAHRLGLIDAAHLQRLADTDSFPNYHHLKEYYMRTEMVTYQYAQDAQDAIIGRSGDRAVSLDKAIEFGEKTIIGRNRARKRVDPDLLLTVGTARYNRARDHSKRGDRAKAQDDLTRALAWFADAEKSAEEYSMAVMPELYYGRALCLLERAQYEDAIAACTQAIAGNRHFAEAFSTRATAHMRLNQPDQALRDLDEALRLADRLAPAWYNRGQVHLTLRRYQQAQSDLEKAYLCGYPDRGDLELARGAAYNGQDEWKEAAEALTIALGLLDEKRQAEAYRLRQEALYRLGRLDEARSDLQYLLHNDDGKNPENSRYLKQRYRAVLRDKLAQAAARQPGQGAKDDGTPNSG